MADSIFAESDVDGLLREVDAAGASSQLEIQSEADVRSYVLAEHPGHSSNETLTPYPDVPLEASGVPVLELNCQTLVKELVAATKYILSRQKALEKGEEFPVKTSMARQCGRCKTRWPTFMHLWLTPTPPLYLCCAVCMKRIPVGHDIRSIPKRKAQPDIVDMQGRSMQLSGKMLNGTISTINTRQQCVAEDCPLKSDKPHSVGLFTYLGYSPPSAVASWAASLLRRAPQVPIPAVSVKYNPRMRVSDKDQFWGGNSSIPSQVQEWTTVIIHEERLWQSGDSQAIEDFQKKYPTDVTDKMRASINAFRAYHCFYRPLNTEGCLVTMISNIQEDIIPEHLRLEPPGSKAWVERLVPGLTKVAAQDLATDDRECGICKGVYEEGISGNGVSPESAVKLPLCGHYFGSECTRLILTTKDEGGWGMRHCPICRGEVYKDGTSRTSTAGAVDSAPLEFGFEI